MWRTYTTSLRRAQSFARIEPLRFPDGTATFSAGLVRRREGEVVKQMEETVGAALKGVEAKRRVEMRRQPDPTLRAGSETGYAGGMAPRRRTDE